VSGPVFVTDGSAESMALAKWLGGGGVVIVEARDGKEVARIVASRRRAGLSERMVAVGEQVVAQADFAAADALRVARDWLVGFSPIDARIRGHLSIQEAIGEERAGADLLMTLRSSLGTRAEVSGSSKRRGRPPGSDPFRGVGFDICVALLLGGDIAQTERSLAQAVSRSQFGVHRVLVELERRRYIERPRAGNTRPRSGWRCGMTSPTHGGSVWANAATLGCSSLRNRRAHERTSSAPRHGLV